MGGRHWRHARRRRGGRGRAPERDPGDRSVRGPGRGPRDGADRRARHGRQLTCDVNRGGGRAPPPTPPLPPPPFGGVWGALPPGGPGGSGPPPPPPPLLGGGGPPPPP